MKHGRSMMAAGLVLALASAVRAQVTQRISVSTSGTEANDHCGSPTISGDGRSIAFETKATNLVQVDANGLQDVFCRDWRIPQSELLSLDASGSGSDGVSFASAISDDGRYVAFMSAATDLVPGDTNGQIDIFVRDRSTGTTQRVSISSTGAQANLSSASPAISADGRYVVFSSGASNLVAGDTNGVPDVFLRDRLTGVTQRISITSFGAQANDFSTSPAVSADGRYVVFTSAATNLGVGDTNGVDDVFIRDRGVGSTGRISLSTSGVQGNGRSSDPSISADGQSVVFLSEASNLIGWDTNGKTDVYYRAWANNYNELVSVGTTSALANGNSSSPVISADGRCVAFTSAATNLVSGDGNQKFDVFVRDRSLGTTERVSVSSTGEEADDHGETPAISSDGRFVAFASRASNLVPGDTSGVRDIFLHDRDATGFTSLCHPGVSGVRACPCGNAPSASGRGCDNSAATGGAYMTAAGAAYLSSDSLAFTTYAEKPTALSVLMQGDALNTGGLVYGQGVRCVAGSLLRLYANSASAGSVTMPGPSDAKISGRSAAKGDVIQPGERRWYLVSYRDPIVLGGCPSSRTFNTTPTGEVIWMP